MAYAPPGSLEAPVRSLPRSLALIAVITLAGGLTACGSDGATVTVGAPDDGATVAGGVDVNLAADGITIEKAGTVRDGAGHFHVLADTGCAKVGEVIPKDADHVHLGKGQAEATVYLEPGKHELCVQVGDGEHHALDVTRVVKVDVGVGTIDQWCSTISEVDDLFQVTDNSSDDLAVKQVGYESIRRLLAQVHARLDLVDADTRAAVTTAIDAASTIAKVMATVDDQAQVEQELAPIFNAADDPFTPAAGWIQDTCNVSITD
ncbi:MAG: DUF4399 domain-containing protein [Acidimicrobiales bacterium]